jgi:hypothetical protein
MIHLQHTCIARAAVMRTTRLKRDRKPTQLCPPCVGAWVRFLVVAETFGTALEAEAEVAHVFTVGSGRRVVPHRAISLA